MNTETKKSEVLEQLNGIEQVPDIERREIIINIREMIVPMIESGELTGEIPKIREGIKDLLGGGLYMDGPVESELKDLDEFLEKNDNENKAKEKGDEDESYLENESPETRRYAEYGKKAEKEDLNNISKRTKNLLQKTLKNPSLLNKEDPALLAALKVLNEENDDNLLKKLEGLLMKSNENKPSKHLQKKIDKLEKDGIEIKSDDENNTKIEAIKSRDDIEAAEDNLNEKIINITKKNNVLKGKIKRLSSQKPKTKELSEEISTTEENSMNMDNFLIDIEDQLRILKSVKPYYEGTRKLSSKQMLAKIIELKTTKEEEGVDIERVAELVDEKISAEKTTLTNNAHREMKEGKWTTERIMDFQKHWISVRPTLTGILKGLSKSDELKDVEPEKLEELSKNYNNVNALRGWINKQGKEKAIAVVAYLEMALAEKRINKVSQGFTKKLVENMRLAKRKIIMEGIEENEELETDHSKMNAYLKEMNKWDEDKVRVNMEVIENAVSKSTWKTVPLLVGAGVGAGYALPMIGGVGTIGSVLSYIGWGNAAALGAHEAGRKAVKEFSPEHKKVFEQIGTRAIGCFILPGVGIMAPEMIKGLKWVVKNKENAAKTVKTTGKVVSTGYNGTKAVAGGGIKVVKGIGGAVSKIGKVFTSPIRRKKLT